MRAQPRTKWRAAALAVAVVAGATACSTSRAADPGGAAPSSAGASASASPDAASGEKDSSFYAPQVRASAQRAGVSPQLLMAILYNESYKPHDPAFQRSWQKIKKDAAFGIVNMHKAAFDETKQGRPFAHRDWEELPDDPALAVEAAAWFLHDLARQLPADRPGTYTKDELLALGYNTGAGNMAAFARGARPGSQAQSYLDRLHANWDKAGEAVRG
ncbi:transglycosylase SLT domain-containing protein [Streptomyces gamaensis]|uniref:Transglycosylase SLT domain-containing protein n=1 Tax=Streptomyces gamaensis TaxID=1763542 RepID=A0ABW0Z2X9_9ACTN